MQTNSAVELNKNIKWSESPWHQSGRKKRSMDERICDLHQWRHWGVTPSRGGDTLIKINIFAAGFRRTLDKQSPLKAERVRVVGR